MSSAARCGRLETAVVELQRRLGLAERTTEYVLGQLSETNLKLTYVLRWFKFQKQIKSPLVDPITGKPSVAIESLTLETMYARDREKFIEILLDEHQRQQDAAKAGLDVTKTSTAFTPGPAREPGPARVAPIRRAHAGQNGDGTDATALHEAERPEPRDVH